MSVTIHRGRFIQLLLLAIAAWTANYVRCAIGPLQEAVRTSLSLSDNQMALLQGMAIAVPIALASIPLGLLADRTSRTRILVFSMTLALLSCVMSALSSDLLSLFAARCLTGLSLPGILVATYSMAGDLFPPGERGRATMAVAIGEISGAPAAFALGGSLLVMVGATPAMRLTGWELPDWNRSLLWMGGILVPILLLMFLLRDPPRTEVVIEKPPLRAVWPELWRYRSVAMPLQLGRATVFIADGAVFVWGAPLFARNYHLSPDRIGAILGAVLLVSGLLGPVLGGPLVDFCQRHGGPRRSMMILACVALLSVPFAFFSLMPNAIWAGVMMAGFLTLGFAIAAAALALSLIVIPGELRGLNLGISIVVGSLFFVGLAPLTVSGLSSMLGGEMKIGEALAVVCGTACLVNAAVFGLSARYFPRDRHQPSPVFAVAGAPGHQ